jgi:plastocyanin
MHGCGAHASKLVINAVLFAAMGLATSTNLIAQGTEVRRFELRIENGRLADDLKTIQIHRGDAVELVWSADRHTVLHLHGYDVEVTIAPGESQTMKLRARATGRFPIEAHGRHHRILVYLEVHPR